jgi:hypothetical protein
LSVSPDDHNQQEHFGTCVIGKQRTLSRNTSIIKQFWTNIMINRLKGEIQHTKELLEENRLDLLVFHNP